MANEVQAYVDTFIGAGAAGVSADVTFSFAITAEFLAEIPVRINVSANLSIPAEISFYRSTDGGNSWEDQKTLAAVFPTDYGTGPEHSGDGADEHDMTKIIKLESGQYLIRVMTGSGTAGTFSCELETARVVSAYA